MGTITRSFANLITASGPSSVSALTTLTANNIQFPSTQVSSANANNLDDYEEGTWTPTDISGASLSFTGAEGTYVKIGRQVIASFILTFPSTANGTAVYIGGLPFTPANGNDNFQGNVSTTNYGSSDIVLWCTFAPSSGIRLRNYSDSALSNANLSTKYIAGQTIYRI